MNRKDRGMNAHSVNELFEVTLMGKIVVGLSDGVSNRNTANRTNVLRLEGKL